jgi:DNA-binding protein HU-beta
VTKQEFVDAVAQRSGLNRREAGQALDAVLDTITDALKRRDSVNFTGFGKFATSERKARMGVNPRNPGQKVHIPAATVPKFTAGSALKQSVRGG